MRTWCRSARSGPPRARSGRSSWRERRENRQYTSKIKTLVRRLETAAGAGDAERVDADHRELVSTIDKAVKRHALHANNGARKKARAARLRSGAS